MYKSVEEIDNAYSQHLESLELSGFEFDREKLLADWANAVYEFNHRD